jgi:hypothetical protein
MKSISVFAFVATCLASHAAWAGCEPACPKGQQCRYEAAGGKFYCEALPSNGGSLKPSGGVKPAAPGGVAPAGGAPAPKAETPK